MDAVELPLPANVVVSKLLASDGFGRVGEPESRGSVGADPSIFGSPKASGYSPYRRDTKLSLSISEYNSVSRDKRTDAELRIHENMLPSFKCEEKGRKHHLGEVDRPILSLPKHEGKPFNRKSVKKLSSFPCSKRPRTDQPENSIRAAGADEHEAMSKMIGYDLIRCTSAEKSRMVRQKRVQDGKRIDKKNCRASLKTKYDSFTSKGGLIISDSVSGGNDILGIYGIKAGLPDVTKHVEELSLNELLDGRYSYPNLCPEKGKKASNVNENILLSVKKACSVLPPNCAVDSSDNKKAFMSLLNPSSCSANMSDCDDKGKCMEELFSKNPFQENLSDSTLYQPKDILERLALSPAQDLEALILSLSINSVPLQSTMLRKKNCSASLPPFPWSFSLSSAWKPGVDSGKVALTRNTCQGKWVRIGSSSTSTGDDHICFSDLELKTFDNNEDSINQRKIDDLLQDVKAVTNSPLFDGPLRTSHATAVLPEAHIPDSINSIKGFGASGSFSSKQLKLLGEHADSSDSHLECVFKDNVFLRTSESEVDLRCQENESKLVDPSKFSLRFKDSEVGQKEPPTGSTDGCTERCYSYPCKSYSGGCNQSLWHLPTPEISKPGYSPRLLAAAEILCEMARCSNATVTQNDTTGNIKWPKASSQKTMKTGKSVSSMEKTERQFLGARYHDPIKRSTVLPSVKHKLMSEKKTDFSLTNNSGRDSVRWSFPPEGAGASPGKLERNHHLVVNQRPLHGNSVRPFGLMLSPSPVEKGFDNQQKLRRATLKTSPVAFGGTYIKDWSRGRSKRG